MASMIFLTKFDALQRCLARIAAKTPASVDLLQNDLDAQDIIALNLERAVQVCVDIAAHVVAQHSAPAPSTMGEGFDRLHELEVISEQTALRMKNAVGFRNISVHEYQKIDWLIVYRIITEHLDDFRDFARQVLNWTESRGDKFSGHGD
ncbi:type VII toxin-antitoxin system HepT family RNase toxin [Geoalkalibacter halelectricus]|uniref:type VII toxin-antitoxin system HepT family RNase toxin n=1 Tax=Geoalkalibacter halelectricus TaxID=2847045 RepID=UPI003D25672C